jgi:cbb3-type cytochrome oxidase maturation protein
MESIWVLIPVSLLLVLVIVGVLVWAVNAGQFDQLDEAGQSLDEPLPTPTPADGPASAYPNAAKDERTP